LVLAEVLAALPLEQVVRLMLLGSPRLEATGSLPWVLRRMTGLHLEALLKVGDKGDRVKKAMYSDLVFKRLHGRVFIDNSRLMHEVDYYENCVSLCDLIPGRKWTCVYSLEEGKRAYEGSWSED